MRFINLIVVHCSATRCDRCYTEHDLTTDHLRRGFSGAGYHFYIRKNGDIKSLRPLSLPGAHVRGWNAGSIGVCYEGGLDECGRPADTRTLFQKHSLRVLVLLLLKDYPGSRLCGHRDLSPDLNHNGEIVWGVNHFVCKVCGVQMILKRRWIEGLELIESCRQ